MKNRLLQLLLDNRQSKGRVARLEQKAREATVYVYDMLVATDADAEWWGGVSAQSLVPQLDQLDVDVIHLRINSPGGDVFAGQAIAAALERHKAQVVAHIDGLAASAATAIAVAADEVVMAAGAMFMIHNAWTIAIGDKNDFIEVAALLEKVDGTLADRYAAHTGKPVAELKTLMDAETWFTAEEAVEFGFANAVEGDEGKDAKASKTEKIWNLRAFEKAPAAASAPVTDETPTAEDAARRERLAAALSRIAA
jgi:ATP-dependent Clp protease protease subunit